MSFPNEPRCVTIITTAPRPCRRRETALKRELPALWVFSLASTDSGLLLSYAEHPPCYLSSSLPELHEVTSLPSLTMSQRPNRSPSPEPRRSGFFAKFGKKFTRRNRGEDQHEFFQEPGHQSVEVLTADNIKGISTAAFWWLNQRLSATLPHNAGRALSDRKYPPLSTVLARVRVIYEISTP